MKYQKKPVVVEATQWFKNGDHPLDYANEKVGFEKGEVRTWTGDEVKALGWEGQVVRYYRTPACDGQNVCGHCGEIMHNHGWIDCGYGGRTVCPGDWIICSNGFYPVKPYAFKSLYEPVPENSITGE